MYGVGLRCVHGVLAIVPAGLRRGSRQLLSHGLDQLSCNQLKDAALQHTCLCISLQTVTAFDVSVHS